MSPTRRLRLGSARSSVGEPPVLVDPRRWGAVIGVVGGLVFVLSYAPPLGAPLRIASGIASVCLALAALFELFVRPRPLGPFRQPARRGLLVYGCCVAAELAVIGVGSRLLISRGSGDLRPALIAGVVGAHFLPFAWAFGERMFYRMGAALVVLGCLGLLAGYAVGALAAEAAAVLSGLVMLAFLVLYSRGRFASRETRDVPSPRPGT